MERVAPNSELIPSILDRLVDLAPGEMRDAPADRVKLASIRKSVRSDLEDLLNTRWRCSGQLNRMESLQSSLANYGIPDFSGGNMLASQDPDIVFEAIERAIERFEPRLLNVSIRPLQVEQAVDRTLRFQIDATLYVEPLQERVRFNSALDSATGKISVEPGHKS